MIRKIRIRNALKISEGELIEKLKQRFPHLKDVTFTGVPSGEEGKTIIRLDIDEDNTTDEFEKFIESFTKKEDAQMSLEKSFQKLGTEILQKFESVEKKVESLSQQIQASQTQAKNDNETLKAELDQKLQGILQIPETVNEIKEKLQIFKKFAEKL